MNIMFLRTICLLLVLFFTSNFTAQTDFHITKSAAKSQKINFKLVNNLIIIPVEINGVELSFLLDTGVSKPIIFYFEGIDEVLKLNHSKRIYIRGLGNGEPIEAIKSEYNKFKVGDVQNNAQDMYVVYDQNLSFAPRLGFPVQGVIGYDFFKKFIVEVNYSSKYIRVYEPDSYKYKKCRNCKTVPIQLHNFKPYINSFVTIDSSEISVKLLVDTGGSDALWLFEDDSLGIHLGNRRYFDDFLGHGLNGSVYGKRSRIESFRLVDFELENPNVAFPDSVSTFATRLVSDRNGSISGDILKRFNIVFDYPNEKVTFKKNRFFREEFSYNKSGIELEHNGIRLLQEEVIEMAKSNNPLENPSQTTSSVKFNFDRRLKLSVKPAFGVVELRENSPAYRAGIQLGDVIISVNGKQTHSMELQEVMALFQGETGKKMHVKVERDGVLKTFSFELESLLE